MNIRKVIIKNFRSFSNKETEIDINHFNLFVGENGAGKTSLIVAIKYALFGTQGMDIKAEDLVNKINKDNMMVRLVCEKDNNSIIIERGRIKRQSYVKLIINDKELDLPSVKEYDKKIEELLGFDYKMFDYFYINSHIFSKNFFKMKKSERDTFLKKVIGIEDFHEFIDKLKELKKDFTYKKENLEKEIDFLKNLENEKEQKISEMNLSSNIKEINKKLEELNKEKEKLLKEIKKIKENVEKEEKLKSLKIKLSELEKSIEIEEKELNSDYSKEDLEKLENRIKTIKKNIQDIKLFNSKKDLIKKAKQKFYQKIFLLRKKRDSLLKDLNKVNSAIEAIKNKGTYLNKITKGDLKSFVEKNGDGIIKFLFMADKNFYFEKKKVFSSVKIEINKSNLKIKNDFDNFKNSLLKGIDNFENSTIHKIEIEKQEILLKYKEFIKKLYKEIREIEINDTEEVYQNKLEKLYAKKIEIEKNLRIKERIRKMQYEIKLVKSEYFKLKKYEGSLELFKKANEELNRINEKIFELSIEQKKHKELNELKEDLKKYENEIKKRKKELLKIRTKITKTDEMIKKDAKNAIHKITEDFLKIFNYYIKLYSKEIETKFDIKIRNDFSFIIKERAKVINYSTLSKGEETILNLIIIFSLNETLKVMSNIKFNLLILDEVDGTLDENNFIKVINKLGKLEKNIIFVSHRKEIYEIEDNLKDIAIYQVKKDLFTKIERKK